MQKARKVAVNVPFVLKPETITTSADVLHEWPGVNVLRYYYMLETYSTNEVVTSTVQGSLYVHHDGK